MNLVIALNGSTSDFVWQGTNRRLFERAVTAAASAAAMAEVRGYSYGLLSNAVASYSGKWLTIPVGASSYQLTHVLEALAMASPYVVSMLPEVIQSERDLLPAGSTVLLVTGAITDSMPAATQRDRCQMPEPFGSLRRRWGNLRRPSRVCRSRGLGTCWTPFLRMIPIGRMSLKPGWRWLLLPAWRARAITAASLFLEGCALYLLIAVVAGLTRVEQLHMSFWLVIVALAWAYGLSWWIMNLSLTPALRGLIGFAVGLPSLLVLTAWSAGEPISAFGLLLGGSAKGIGTFVGTVIFLLIIWWRGVELRREEITLDSVRSAFQVGMAVLLAAALVDAVTEGRIVSGFLVVGFFAVGLPAMALARFSAESGEEREMPRQWIWPIIACVGVVLLLGLLVSGLGIGGLDDVTRAILDVVGNVGFRILEPVLMLIGLLAGVLVSVGNWFSEMLGGGDLQGLLDAQRRINEFHESLREAEAQPGGNALFTALQWTAAVLGAGVASYIVYRLFRARRRGGSNSDVTESRESLFSLKHAREDVGEAFSGLFGGVGANRRRSRLFRSPRDYYHALLESAERAGRPKEESETPREHQRGLSGTLPADPVARTVDQFQGYHYGSVPVDPEQMERLEADREELEQFLKDNPRDG